MAAKKMIELIEEDPPKLAIFGPGLSDELTVTGQIAPFYNVLEVSMERYRFFYLTILIFVWYTSL